MRRIVRLLVVVAALAASVLTAIAVPAGAAPAAPAAPSAGTRSAAGAGTGCGGGADDPFGGNVCVFNDRMPQAEIQADLDAIASARVPVSSQFGDGRYAVFFEPGTYGSACRTTRQTRSSTTSGPGAPTTATTPAGPRTRARPACW